jgi:hypothetical protein
LRSQPIDLETFTPIDVDSSSDVVRHILPSYVLMHAHASASSIQAAKRHRMKYKNIVRTSSEGITCVDFHPTETHILLSSSTGGGQIRAWDTRFFSSALKQVQAKKAKAKTTQVKHKLVNLVRLVDDLSMTANEDIFPIWCIGGNIDGLDAAAVQKLAQHNMSTGNAPKPLNDLSNVINPQTSTTTGQKRSSSSINEHDYSSNSKRFGVSYFEIDSTGTRLAVNTTNSR